MSFINKQWESVSLFYLLRLYKIQQIIFRKMNSSFQQISPLEEGLEKMHEERITTKQKSKLNEIQIYGRSPQFYWKSNYLFPVVDPIFYFDVEDLKFEELFFIQHKQVIKDTVLRLWLNLEPRAQENCRNHLEFIEQPLPSSSFEQEFFETQLFLKKQKAEFKKILKKKAQWKVICLTLLKEIPKQIYQELLYIFYKSFKMYLKVGEKMLLNPATIDICLTENMEELLKETKQILKSLQNCQNAREIIGNIALTVLLAVNGQFNNKLYTREPSLDLELLELKIEKSQNWMKKNRTLKYRYHLLNDKENSYIIKKKRNSLIFQS